MQFYTPMDGFSIRTLRIKTFHIALRKEIGKLYLVLFPQEESNTYSASPNVKAL